MVIDVRHQDKAWGFLSIKNLPHNVVVYHAAHNLENMQQAYLQRFRQLPQPLAVILTLTRCTLEELAADNAVSRLFQASVNRL